MEQEKEQKLHFVRNNNGEWISIEHAVFLDGASEKIYTSKAKQYNLPLTPQTCYHPEIWYYKREIEAIYNTRNTHIKNYHNL